jgi:hypothetical protein
MCLSTGFARQSCRLLAASSAAQALVNAASYHAITLPVTDPMGTV